MCGDGVVSIFNWIARRYNEHITRIIIGVNVLSRRQAMVSGSTALFGFNQQNDSMNGSEWSSTVDRTRHAQCAVDSIIMIAISLNAIIISATTFYVTMVSAVWLLQNFIRSVYQTTVSEWGFNVPTNTLYTVSTPRKKYNTILSYSFNKSWQNAASTQCKTIKHNPLDVW